MYLNNDINAKNNATTLSETQSVSSSNLDADPLTPFTFGKDFEIRNTFVHFRPPQRNDCKRATCPAEFGLAQVAPPEVTSLPSSTEMRLPFLPSDTFWNKQGVNKFPKLDDETWIEQHSGTKGFKASFNLHEREDAKAKNKILSNKTNYTNSNEGVTAQKDQSSIDWVLFWVDDGAFKKCSMKTKEFLRSQRVMIKCYKSSEKCVRALNKRLNVTNPKMGIETSQKMLFVSDLHVARMFEFLQTLNERFFDAVMVISPSKKLPTNALKLENSEIVISAFESWGKAADAFVAIKNSISFNSSN